MLRYGEPPFLECSGKGDKRFSAFYARIKADNNRSIEEIYQASKCFADGRTGLHWKEAKGRRPTNENETLLIYSQLWDWYILKENQHLLAVLRAATGLSDIFGQQGHACQATELWRIRNGPF